MATAISKRAQFKAQCSLSLANSTERLFDLKTPQGRWSYLEAKTYTKKTPTPALDPSAYWRFDDMACSRRTSLAPDVHANKICLSNRDFVAAAAPKDLDLSREAFFSAIFDHSRIIVDLTHPDDRLEGLYPNKKDESKTYESIRLSCVGIEDLSIEHGIKKYIFNISKTTDDRVVSKKIESIRCSTWKDRTAPTTELLSALVKELEKTQEMFPKSPNETHNTDPLIGKHVFVHCVGGVGRTGTLIASYVMNLGIYGQDTEDEVVQRVLDVVLAIRSARNKVCVSSSEQLEAIITFALNQFKIKTQAVVGTEV